MSRRLLVLRHFALASMKDRASAIQAIKNYTTRTVIWVDKYPQFCEPIVTSIALLSLAHLMARAEVFGIISDASVTEISHRLLDITIARIPEASNQAIANVFWALARLNVSPASVVPAYEASLAEAFLTTRHKSTVLGVSHVLWALSMLKINPLEGRLLQHLVKRLEECIENPALKSAQHVQVKCNAHVAFSCGRCLP